MESPVYLGDLIRVAELSSATLYIDGNSIDLNENTLIRLTRAPDGESLQIIMNEGNLSLAAAADSGRISLDINGRFIQVGSGDELIPTVLNVISAEDGIVLQVNEGTAHFIEEGRTQEIQAGRQLALDAGGAVHEERTAVITYPAFNARYLNNSNTPFTVNFSWNRINFNDGELLRLEIASDRNFNRIIHTQQNLDRHAQTVLNNGLWHWRLSFADTILYEGRFSIINGAGPRLHSPAANSVFKFTSELPVLNFQWDEVDEASFYILEVCNTPDFTAPRIQRQSSITFLTDSNLGAGTWYWRVRPVFSSVYIGNSSFSQTSFFNIEQTIIEPVLQNQPATPQLHLTTPARGTRIEGLTASRQQTVFSWDYGSEITSSRFVLSRNSNPFQGQPATEIHNPDRNISISNLTEGMWYWNVEVQTADGFTVSSAQHGSLQVLPVPVLPAAQNLQPARGRRFSMNDLLAQRSLSFSWQAVRGANAYIVTIIHQTDTGRRQVFQSRPITSTNFLLEDLRLLDIGTFIWQVEAVNRGQGGTIDQRGVIAESTFIMDIVLPGVIQVEGSGVVNE
jgi:hypothetical protein